MPTITLNDLRVRVYSRVENNMEFYTLAEVDRAINQAVKVLNLYTGFIQTTISVDGGSVAGQVDYLVPDGILFALRVSIDGKMLDKNGWTSMGKTNAGWRLETTDNTGMPVSRWIPIGLKAFSINPADATGGLDIQVLGVAEPTLLVDGEDVIQIPNEFDDLMIDMAAHILPLKESGLIFSQASNYYIQFLSKMKEFKRYTTLRFPQYWIEVQSPVKT